VLVGMFLLGSWFVRSGVMEDTEKHLPLFRKMALYGLPIGIGLGLLDEHDHDVAHRPATATTAGASCAGSRRWATCRPASATSAWWW
jgi:hypothetical protein